MTFKDFFKFNTISKKIVFYYTVIVLIISSLFFSINDFLTSHFLKYLASLEAVRHSKYVTDVLEKEIDSLKKLSIHWAKWDNTYEFMQDKNVNYLKTNFSGSTLYDINIDIFLYLDTNANLFYCRVYDKDKKVEYTISYLPFKLDKGFIKKIILKKRPMTGFIEDGNKLYIFVAHPILRSKGSGPCRGVLFLAREFKVDFLKNSFPYMDFALVKSVPKKANYLTSFSSANLGNIQVRSNYLGSKIVTYIDINSIYKNINFILKTVFDSIVLKNKTNFILRWASFFGLVLISTIIISYFITKKVIIKRLETLSKAVKDISPQKSVHINLPKFEEREFSTIGRLIENLFYELVEEKKLLKKLFDTIKAGIGIYSENRFVWINREFIKVSGYSEDEIYNMDVFDFIHPEDRESTKTKILQGMQDYIEDGFLQYQARMISKTGKEIYLLVNSQNIMYRRQKARLVTFVDITPIKMAEKKIRFLAYYDSLTGLYNRNFVEKKLNDIIRTNKEIGKRTCLILLDIKDFSRFNLVFGQSFGDQILQTLGTKLRDLVREEDIPFRYGMDILGLIINGASIRTFYDIIERIKQKLETQFVVQGQKIMLEFFIGMSIYPDFTQDPFKLFTHSEMALSLARKFVQLPYVAYDSQIEEKCKNRLEIQALLREAVEKDEFIVHYQPIYEINTGKLVKCEALIRWKQKDKGFIPPSEFIPIAEETGIITKITKIVFEKVCAQISVWGQKGRKINVALNVSALDFKQKDFISFIKKNILDAQIEPSRIEIEVTERLLMENVEYSLNLLKQLKEFGISISIDDFGTGYSSLAYLSYFPIDLLKIDISFVRRIGKSKEDEAIIETIINLAHTLKIKALAEGIETQEQLDFLRKRKCDYGQGYYLGPPCPPEDIEKRYF